MPENYNVPPHGHANEWHRFVLRSRIHREAAELAADLDWWLHCWDWEEADVDGVCIEDKMLHGE